MLHSFEYKDKNGSTIIDTAFFIHSSQPIRMISTAIKYDKGINFTGTIKNIKSYFAEMMAKMPKSQMPPNQQSKNKE